MKLATKILFIVMAFQLFNCSYANQKTRGLTSGDKRPSWIDNPYSVFSERQYIVGVGSGDTRDAAEKNAIGQIARVFKTRVTVDETLIESVMETFKNNKASLSTQSQMLNKTRLQSDINLKNVKIEQVYFSEKEGIYYALAYLDRNETAQMLQTDFEENDALLKRYFQKSHEDQNKLHKLADIHRALAFYEMNSLLNEQFKVLTRGQTLQPSVSKDQLDAAVRKIRESIRVVLLPEANTPAEVTDYMREMIGKLGFQMVDKGGDIEVKYGLTMNRSDLNRPGIVAFNWHFKVEIFDRINNASLKTFNLKKRTAAISEGEVKARILRKIKKQLDTVLYRQILDYLNAF